MTTVDEWNERFSRGSSVCPTPDPFFARLDPCYSLLPGWRISDDKQPGRGLRALDLACGSGRHAVNLARRGFHTTAIDFSLQALIFAQKFATQKNVIVDYRSEDVEKKNFRLSQRSYDLVAVFFFLHRPLFPALRDCLRTGGLIIYKTYCCEYPPASGRAFNPIHTLEPNELLRIFVGFRVLRYEEEWEGKGTAALIAQKI